MKRSISVVMLFAATFCATAQTTKKTDKSGTTAPGVAIPKDAVKNSDGTYSYTDKQGKKWKYSPSPFGVIRTAMPESGAETQPAPNSATGLKVIDKGDVVRFERASPFGPIGWEKKKADLTDEERRLVDSQNQSKTETAKPDAK